MNQDPQKKIKGMEPDIRHLYDMKKVIYDQEWLEAAPNKELYYMYRGVEPPLDQLPSDLPEKKRQELRYDITVIPSNMLGKEFVKTKGHYHQGEYGELYIVLEGKAIYLLQKEGEGEIKDVYFVEAERGDHVPIPPGYGHITINPSQKTLIMANWISIKCHSEYKEIGKKQGACYYYTTEGWIENDNYKKIPKIYSKRPAKSMPKNLNFLT